MWGLGIRAFQWLGCRVYGVGVGTGVGMGTFGIKGLGQMFWVEKCISLPFEGVM